ncbi:fructose-bisphosphate aldolase class I [Rhodoligotrophos appendicifer]|uniref:class I fructose-bisphosphate aldolase n=1 Tax=Rhodoligotrophos appendicifer TaxID=987056 RepID=UPI0011870FE4|nr:class I fructose-bisphosphate aldolase [Rhodoligotrophos appendicifer]
MSMTLEQVAKALVADGKGILAADESTSTIKKRFDAIALTSTEEARRDYREMLFRSTEAMTDHISGVILFDETIRQSAKDGTPFVELLTRAGCIPGIKVDAGTKPLAYHPDEQITEGLDGLRERCQEYHKLGARFTKWRAVITIGKDIPSRACILTNTHALARYAAIAQEAGLVPIVEPELLMDGDHTIDRCLEVTERVLHSLYAELNMQDVVLEQTLLKPNMVISGTECPQQAGIEEVAEKTVKVLKRTVPAAVPGIVFLSGGQSDEIATAHLSAMNAGHDLPWPLTFSYGRALQAAAIKAWGGKSENVAAGQRAFTHRAKMNGLAAQGRYSADLEKAA